MVQCEFKNQIQFNNNQKMMELIYRYMNRVARWFLEKKVKIITSKELISLQLALLSFWYKKLNKKVLSPTSCNTLKASICSRTMKRICADILMKKMLRQFKSWLDNLRTIFWLRQIYQSKFLKSSGEYRLKSYN